MNPESMSKPEIAPAAELLNQAFELAYFILGDRPASIYVAMAAMNKLKTASSNQDRRHYYTPTGRSAFPAARTKVNLSEIQLLQRLVYIESELFERLLEGQQPSVQQDDLIIRYIKHLIRITTKHNSFYVALGLCRLLYNYSTGQAAEIYNLVMQDPERIRDDYYYRSRKKRLMEEIKERQPQEDSQKYASLVKECLIRFTPWDSACVLPKELDPDGNVVRQLFFEGGDPDKEHLVELNRIHSLIHPDCLERLTTALSLNPADERLELPSFFVANGGPRPPEDRFSPGELTAGELDAIKRYLDKNAIHRQQFSEGQLRLLIDGQTQADFKLDDSANAEFNLADGSELIEIRSIGLIGADEDTSLGVCLLAYDQSGILPADLSIALGKGHQLSLTVSPVAGSSVEVRGATLRVGYQQTAPTLAISKSPQHMRSWLYELIDFHQGRLRWLTLALGPLLVVFGTTGLWIYFHSKSVTNPIPVTQLQEPPVPASSATLPLPKTGAASPPKEIPQTPTGVSPVKPWPPDAVQAKGFEGTRGTNLRPASALLLTIKRVYVDPLGKDEFSQQLRENLIGKLRATNRFEIVTIRDEADAVFKGSAARSLKGRSSSSVVLELVNARGQVVWSLSSRKNGKTLSGDAVDASATISEVLLHDIAKLERRR